MDRREFLRTAVAAGLLPSVGSDALQAATKPIPKRLLGRTREKLSIVGLGGMVVVGTEQKEANDIVAGALDRGVNYVDVAPTYGNGEAEERLGVALQGKRDRVFLACKAEQRDKAGAAQQLETSLKRLKTDHFDLYQLHAITTLDDVKTALGPGGAMEAFQQAREKGQVRYLGFSAHSVEAALAAMNGFKFDTILFPINWVCYFQGNFGPQVLKAAREKGMGCLAIKAMAHTPWPAGAAHDYPKCWYEPERDPGEAELALRFTLSEPITAAVPPSDVRLFRLALSVAERFKPVTAAERKELQARSAGLTPIFKNSA